MVALCPFILLNLPPRVVGLKHTSERQKSICEIYWKCSLRAAWTMSAVRSIYVKSRAGRCRETAQIKRGKAN